MIASMERVGNEVYSGLPNDLPKTQRACNACLARVLRATAAWGASRRGLANWYSPSNHDIIIQIDGNRITADPQFASTAGTAFTL